MTLDEAIAISDEIGKGDTERAANNRWLAEKLRVLKWVEDCHIIEEARRARDEMHGWQADWQKVSDENAKLREELAKARDPQRIGGQADPSSFVYAIEQLREFRWQHATNDKDAIPYINNVAAAHERENTKLRELLQRTWDVFHNASGKEFDAVKQELRELGVEVDK